jgi:hypothetical protein
MFTKAQIEHWQGQLAVTLTHDRFRGWLESKKSLETLGIRNDCKKCVIAQFIAEHLPHLDAEVGLHHIFVDFPTSVGFIEPGQRIYYMGHPSGSSYAPEIPEWIGRFINIIDRSRSVPEILREDALKALSSAKYD